MVKILLVCSAGMSTSFMVNKMKDSAKARGIEAEIWAVADAEAAANIVAYGSMNGEKVLDQALEILGK